MHYSVELERNVSIRNDAENLYVVFEFMWFRFKALLQAHEFHPQRAEDQHGKAHILHCSLISLSKQPFHPRGLSITVIGTDHLLAIR